jgi:hypothetical protein
LSDPLPLIAGAEHDIPPLSPAAAEALEEVDVLDPEAIAPIAAAESDDLTARELRSRILMLKAGAGPADEHELEARIGPCGADHQSPDGCMAPGPR